MSDSLVVVKVFDLELVDCSSAASFMEEESDDSSVSESLRRRDVWTTEQLLTFLVTERGCISLVRTFGITFNAAHRVDMHCIGIAEVLVE